MLDENIIADFIIPGVGTREQAKVIELGEGEWRTDIDFRLAATK
jgi:hypothetical protein